MALRAEAFPCPFLDLLPDVSLERRAGDLPPRSPVGGEPAPLPRDSSLLNAPGLAGLFASESLDIYLDTCFLRLVEPYLDRTLRLSSLLTSDYCDRFFDFLRIFWSCSWKSFSISWFASFWLTLALTLVFDRLRKACLN
jgi:hypothetical protein